MKFEEQLIPGKILKRYKRFLADIDLDIDNGPNKKNEVIIAHTANTGSMKTCWEENWPVMISYHDNPKRKLKYSLEMTHNGDTWIGVNTAVPNKLGPEAILDGTITELQGYETIKPEQKIGKSRIDIYLYDGDIKEPTNECYVEIKNVTLLAGERLVTFPDGVSTRGQKHLEELISLKEQGIRACMLYIVQREDVDCFSPADDIDPVYGQLLRKAHATGVEILVYQCKVTPEEIKIVKPLPYKL